MGNVFSTTAGAGGFAVGMENGCGFGSSVLGEGNLYRASPGFVLRRNVYKTVKRLVNVSHGGEVHQT